MAKRTITMLTDDLDGSEATETIEFGFDGIQYTIDLSEANADNFHGVMAPYLDAGERVQRPAKAAKSGSVRRSSETERASRDQLRAIRVWARSAGHEVSDRGRIPKEVVAAFNAAHS